MNKQLFCSIIDNIREQIEFDKGFSSALADLVGAETVPLYDHSRITKSLLDLLRIWYPVEDNHCELEHYMFVCNFKGSNGEPKSAEELYDELTSAAA